MNITTLFKSKELKPTWSYSAEQTLWRIHFSEDGFIVGEDRNIDEKTVSFFCINKENGNLLWKENSFGEQWWIGIETISSDRIFLHGFKKPDLPEHKKIICADLHTGKELWRNEHYAFHSLHNNSIFASKDLFERRTYFRLNQEDGEMIEELNELPHDSKSSSMDDNFIFPISLSEQSVSYESISFLLNSVSKKNIHHSEYIAFNNFYISNVYTESNKDNLLTNTLFIFSTEKKKTLFKDILNNQTPYPVPDSFFIHNNTLFFIKERKTLVALTLTQ